MNPLLTGASVYGSDAADILGFASEDVTIANSGDINHNSNEYSSYNPVKGILIIIALLVVVRIISDVI